MYKNPNLTPRERALDLLSKMTLDEKVDQITFYESPKQLLEFIEKGEDFPIRGGCFGNPLDSGNPEVVKVIQDYALNNTRLGIPFLYAFEALHGFLDQRATIFPQCAGLAGSFDPEGVYEMAKQIGLESEAYGVRQVFAPNVDIPRDPRWGRTQEAYGEDPYLSGEMGAAYVRGLQENKVAATAKHYVAYGVPEQGLNIAPVHVGEREVREVMLEPFKKCIDAGVLSIMPAYNEVDGEPLHASRRYVREILRDELGFEGTTISDWGGIWMLNYLHKISPSRLDAGKRAINAGVDIEAPVVFGYGEEFKEAIRKGEVDEKLVDESVLRMLELKFKLGLFENPYEKPELKDKVRSKEAVDLSRRLDEESILLLKNDGMLPLDEKKVGKVAVIGNNAKDSLIGNYIKRTTNCVDFYSGMVNRLGEENVLYAKGCGPLFTTDELIAEAVETAKKADTVFLVLGDRSAAGGDIAGGDFVDDSITCHECYDTHKLEFTTVQQRLFDEVIKLGKPTLLVVLGGRQFAIMNEVEKVNAFMFGWGCGEQGGNAFANLIFGDKTPSAKLSFSFPRSTGHLPCYYNHKQSARGNIFKQPGNAEKAGRDYVSETPKPWMSFGYGLSYTTIEYSNLTAEVGENTTVKVKVDVENKGNYEIGENVLLFVKMKFCPTTPFERQLRKFTKVHLAPGDKKTVEFTLTGEDFTYIDNDMKTCQNKGEHVLFVENLHCEINI